MDSLKINQARIMKCKIVPPPRFEPGTCRLAADGSTAGRSNQTELGRDKSNGY